MPQDFVTYGQDFIVFDTEEAPATSGYIGDLVPMLRRKLKDTGIVVTDDFVGDGVSVEFRLSGYPIKENSERVAVSGSSLATSGYYLSYPSGLLVLTTSAAVGVPVRAVYLYYEHLDSELAGHIEDSVYEFDRRVSTEHGVAGGDISPVLTAEEEALILTIAVRNTFVADAASIASTAYSWKDEEKSVDKSGVIRNYKDIIDLLDAKIYRLIGELVRESGRPTNLGVVLMGGTIPVPFGSVTWGAGNVL